MPAKRKYNRAIRDKILKMYAKDRTETIHHRNGKRSYGKGKYTLRQIAEEIKARFDVDIPVVTVNAIAKGLR